MAIALKAKCSVKDFGNPARQAALIPEGSKDKRKLGRIFGVANGVKQGTDQTGRPYLGLRGSFEAVPENKELETVQAGVCYLPPGIAEMVIVQVQNIPEGQAPSVGFAFDIYIKHADNAIGYEYETVPVIENAATDPLAGLRAQIEQVVNAPAVEDKSKAKK